MDVSYDVPVVQAGEDVRRVGALDVPGVKACAVGPAAISSPLSSTT